MTFGERLKYLREKEKMYQSELAEKLNLAPSTISMYEHGDRDPDTSTLSKIAEIFNVTTDYLLGRTDDLKSIDDRLKKHNITTAASADIDLNKYAELDDDKKDFVKKQMNAMIDMFLKEKKRKNK